MDEHKVPDSLRDLRAALQADGYDLNVEDEMGGLLVMVTASDQACADCQATADGRHADAADAGSPRSGAGTVQQDDQQRAIRTAQRRRRYHSVPRL